MKIILAFIYLFLFLCLKKKGLGNAYIIYLFNRAKLRKRSAGHDW